jgi:hypothetical protein
MIQNICIRMLDMVTGDQLGTIHNHFIMDLEGTRITSGGLFAPLIKVLIIKFMVKILQTGLLFPFFLFFLPSLCVGGTVDIGWGMACGNWP